MNVRYSEKTKKFEKIFQFDLVRKRQNLLNVFKECPLMSDLSVRFFSNSCGLLRISELYQTAGNYDATFAIIRCFFDSILKTKLRICLFSLFVHTNSTIISCFLFQWDGFPKEIFLSVFYGLQGRDLIKQARRRPLIVMLLFFQG